MKAVFPALAGALLFLYKRSMQQYIDAFKSLGDEKRLRIMHLFVRSRQALCVSELVDALNIPQYQVSRHIQHFRQAGLLKVRKEGIWSYYYLNEDRAFKKLFYDFLSKTFSGDPFQKDWKALGVRLSYREKGRCVIGEVSYNEIEKRIPLQKEFTESHSEESY
ncbi:metalloregulator ArsR/SmtB family transcription factor [Balneolaceae bacterium ANBcel3]|nr:metalloregulator ArsR/SmtB family transcription factor [Balneolaceae bacterium ANBcel3]